MLASCHSPVIRGGKVDDAFNLIRGLPSGGGAPPQPGQPDLDEMMHAIATGKEYAWEPPAPPNGA